MLDLPVAELGSGRLWRVLSERVAGVLKAPANAWVLLPAKADTEHLLLALQRAFTDPMLECLPWAGASDGNLYETIVTYGSDEVLTGTITRTACVKACAEQGREAILVLDLTRAQVQEQEEIAGFAREWAQRVSRLGPDRPWARFIWLVGTPRRWADLEDVRLSVVASWEVAASCDSCEAWQRHLDGRPEEEKLWLRCVLPELAAFDGAIVDENGWCEVHGMTELVAVLQSMATRRDWTDPDADLQSRLAHIPQSGTALAVSGSYLPEVLLPLWHQGMIGLVAGVGWDLHAALMSTPGRRHSLDYRVWRGQSRVLGPLLEAQRLSAERLVRERLGNSEFDVRLEAMRADSQMVKPAVSHDSRGASLHELATFARSLSMSWWRAASGTHVGIRNPLAHGRVVEPAALSWLAELAKELPEG